jgi:hypothetical protein
MGAGAAVMGAGYLLQAYNSYQQGEAAYDASRQNAAMLAIRSNLVRRQGEIEAGRVEATGRKYQAAATAATVANQIDPTIGSAASQIAQSGINASADAMKIRAQALYEMWSGKKQAQQVLAEGRSARRQGLIGMLAGGLMAGGTVWSAYDKQQQSGQG